MLSLAKVCDCFVFMLVFVVAVAIFFVHVWIETKQFLKSFIVSHNVPVFLLYAGGDKSLGTLVTLLIIDEVHLLADERGAVIETIVARTQRYVESSQKLVSSFKFCV